MKVVQRLYQVLTSLRRKDAKLVALMPFLFASFGLILLCSGLVFDQLTHFNGILLFSDKIAHSCLIPDTHGIYIEPMIPGKMQPMFINLRHFVSFKDPNNSEVISKVISKTKELSATLLKKFPADQPIFKCSKDDQTCEFVYNDVSLPIVFSNTKGHFLEGENCSLMNLKVQHIGDIAADLYLKQAGPLLAFVQDKDLREYVLKLDAQGTIELKSVESLLKTSLTKLESISNLTEDFDTGLKTYSQKADEAEFNRISDKSEIEIKLSAENQTPNKNEYKSGEYAIKVALPKITKDEKYVYIKLHPLKQPLARQNILLNNEIAVQLFFFDGEQEQVITLAYDPFASSPYSPILSGKYRVRFQPLVKDLPLQIEKIGWDCQHGLSDVHQSDCNYHIRIIENDGNCVETFLNYNRLTPFKNGFQFALIEDKLKKHHLQFAVQNSWAKKNLVYPGIFCASLGILLVYLQKKTRIKGGSVFFSPLNIAGVFQRLRKRSHP